MVCSKDRNASSKIARRLSTHLTFLSKLELKAETQAQVKNRNVWALFLLHFTWPPFQQKFPLYKLGQNINHLSALNGELETELIRAAKFAYSYQATYLIRL